MNAVRTGLPAGAGVPGKQSPRRDGDESDEKKANEHLFAMMHEHVFVVKSSRRRGRVVP